MSGKQYFTDGIAYIGLVILIVCMGYFGIRQTSLFSSQPLETRVKDSRRYEKSGLKPEQSRKIMEELKINMIEGKLFRDPDLTRSMLSDALGVNPNHLSQAINENGSTFNDLINSYRVEEFKNRRNEVKTRKETILSLAFECGFNSKSSFNHIFKNSTGMTPSQYIYQKSQVDF